MGLECFWSRLVLFSALCLSGFCDQDGFLSLSCGATSNYIDSSSISWLADGSYISAGNTTWVSNVEGSTTTSSASVPIRFFPEDQRRKCYKLPLNNVSSSLVLVRAQFVYKNYDNLGTPPAFSVSLGTAITSTVNLGTNDPWTEEIIWPASKETLLFCLHAIPGRGSPVISSLELRPLPRGAYQVGLGELTDKSLRKSYRINSGYSNGSLRFPLDQYDRIWDADQKYTPSRISAGLDVVLNLNMSSINEGPPVAVLQTARVLTQRDTLTYSLPLDTLADYYVILYFAGILPVSPSFDLFINDNLVQSNYTVKMYEASALHLTQKSIKSLNITLKSNGLYPQINAIEVYEILDIPLEASSTTVSALQVIQQCTGLDFGWEDDPCSPKTWDHVGCEGSIVTSLDLSGTTLRSITPTFGDLLDLKTLDLHNTSLTGRIQNLGSLQNLETLNLSFNLLSSFGTELDNLVSLQVLDLQNNSLEGIIPEGLADLQNLHLLNLENNHLQGTLPRSLNREDLEVRTSGNLCLSFSPASCNDASSNTSIATPQVTIVPQKKHGGTNRSAVVTGAIAGALFVVLLISVSVFLLTRGAGTHEAYTDKTEMDMRSWNAARVFSYKEIKLATKNFKEVLGRGSFGSVYCGKLSDGRLVAVKVRYDRSQLGADSFINEVHLLSRISHQNLVGLEGFCHEEKQQILVYEYLPGGSLADHLYGCTSKKATLSWVRRLKIAVDAAKGLDYLHNGSEPRIVHRDIKCSNILLDKEMNAKVCDFGLSKQLVQSDASHVTTIVKGTAGYIDPEYYTSQQLTEKSDVYSFGVVLLELICGREPLRRTGTPDSFNLVLWAKPYLQAGAFEIVDERLQGTFDMESMKRVATVAAKSVERDASRRPNMAEILAELKEAYSLQLSYLAACSN